MLKTCLLAYAYYFVRSKNESRERKEQQNFTEQVAYG